MTDLVLHDVDERVIEYLRAEAQNAERSIEMEAKLVLWRTMALGHASVPGIDPGPQHDFGTRMAVAFNGVLKDEELSLFDRHPESSDPLE